MLLYLQIVEKIYDKNDTDTSDNSTLTAEEDEKDYGYAAIPIDKLQHKYIKIDWLSFLRNITDIPLTSQNLAIFDVEEYFQDFYYLLLRTPKRYVDNVILYINKLFLLTNQNGDYLLINRRKSPYLKLLSNGARAL